MIASYSLISFFFFFNDTATTEIYPLSLHDALPIYPPDPHGAAGAEPVAPRAADETGRRLHDVHRRPQQRHRRHRDAELLGAERSEEHTSELQSPCNLVCRLLLEKKKKKTAKSPEQY